MESSNSNNNSNNNNNEAIATTSSQGIRSTGHTKWDAMYNHLLDYRKKHNNCLVPNRYKDMPQLGSWVSTQRRHYKMLQEGKDSPLTPQRLQLLTKIGFVWATRDPRHVPWEQRYQELLDYKKQHGHCLIPVGYEENPQLANWVSTQRQEWKLFQCNKPSRLTSERVTLLNDVGFVWEAQRGGSRKRKNGTSSTKASSESGNKSRKTPTNVDNNNYDANRPWIAMFKEYLWLLDQGKNPEDDPSLKQWALCQRVAFKKQNQKTNHPNTLVEDGSSKLTSDQYNLLQSIKFNWDSELLTKKKTINHNNKSMTQVKSDQSNELVMKCSSDTNDSSSKVVVNCSSDTTDSSAQDHVFGVKGVVDSVRGTISEDIDDDTAATRAL